ncbi:hypothetical protein F4780DRAFT_726938 [Xylariomycetidae sp. FL0641]|nr:hypothetical protein F4780DRAFT_726938 [Xylariomycetidae sp. FL0641]
MPHFGATFTPGGMDDYYMPPEVIAPAPQRYVLPSSPKYHTWTLPSPEMRFLPNRSIQVVPISRSRG